LRFLTVVDGAMMNEQSVSDYRRSRKEQICVEKNRSVHCSRIMRR